MNDTKTPGEMLAEQVTRTHQLLVQETCQSAQAIIHATTELLVRQAQECNTIDEFVAQVQAAVRTRGNQ